MHTHRNVFDVIECRTEESFTEASSRRIMDWSNSRLEDLLVHLEDYSINYSIPTALAGHLRPRCYFLGWKNPIYSNHAPIFMPQPNHIRHLLLYTHQVCVDNPLTQVLRGVLRRRRGEEWSIVEELFPGIELSATLGWLLQFRELVRKDIVLLIEPSQHFYPKTAEEFRLYQEGLRVAAEQIQPDLPTDDPRFREELAERSHGFDEMPTPTELVEFIIEEVLGALRDGPGRDLDLWLPRLTHLEILQGLLRRAYVETSMKESTVRSIEPISALARVDLPRIANLRNADIVAIRKNDELFEEWRADLAQALKEASSLGSTYSANASTLLASSLKEARDRIRRARTKSGREVVTTASKSFLFAATGAALSGWVFGPHSLPQALLSSAGAGSAAMAVAGGQRLARHRAAKAQDKHYAVVTAED